MSAYHGPQGKGAAKKRRGVKREQAEARNAATSPERTRAYRRAVEHLEALGRQNGGVAA